jgi:hypothetical protein
MSKASFPQLVVSSPLIDEPLQYLSEMQPVLSCGVCGTTMLHIDNVFFTPEGKSRVFSLPVCPRCCLEKETAKSVPVMNAA